jgi:molybdopterin-guanine dinucleotide biosynthesis protein B
LKTKVIAIVGNKGSGKTTTIETLTKQLTKRGYKIAVAKHIPEPNFTIDTEGKDTWRFAQSGAKTIIAVASNEMATIEKMDTTSFSLEEILHRCRDVDLVFLEGFKNITGKNQDIPKIVIVKSAKDALEALETFKPILAFTGLHSIETLNLDVPYLNVFENREKLVDIVEKNVKK